MATLYEDGDASAYRYFIDAQGNQAWYDFAPLADFIGGQLDAPRDFKLFDYVKIPDSSFIPSPFADNIAPGELYFLKKKLTGNGSYDTTREDRSIGNGREIWESWKRAYDIWNGFYIEGRVDRRWVKDRWDEKKPQRDAMDEDHYHRRETDPAIIAELYSLKKSRLPEPHGGGMKDHPGFKHRREVIRVHDSDGEGDEEHDFEDDKLSFDGVQNTLWMPRRWGERTLEVGFDMSPVDYYLASNLELFGGVDCGRAPYPALRSLIQYVRSGRSFDNDIAINPSTQDTIIKKNTWDEVTATIYNMPVPDSDDPEDLCASPLLIYRVMKNLPVSEKREAGKIKRTAELLSGDQTLLLQRDRSSGRKLHKSRTRFQGVPDAWWIPKPQRTLRDYPPRFWPPPKQLKDDSTLPIDSTLWDDEVYKDTNHQAEYFVMHVGDGDLLINGMMVPEGAMAGPLPTFALIEGNRGQVFWWHGPNGRYYKPPGSPKASSANDPVKWDTLRDIPGWEHTGLSAAEVWDQKMDTRWSKARIGNRLEDDDFWESVTKGRTLSVARPKFPPISSLLPPGIGPAHTLIEFDDIESELKYTYTLIEFDNMWKSDPDAVQLSDSQRERLWTLGAKEERRTIWQIIADKVRRRWPTVYPKILARQQQWAAQYLQHKKDMKLARKAPIRRFKPALQSTSIKRKAAKDMGAAPKRQLATKGRRVNTGSDYAYESPAELQGQPRRREGKGRRVNIYESPAETQAQTRRIEGKGRRFYIEGAETPYTYQTPAEVDDEPLSSIIEDPKEEARKAWERWLKWKSKVKKHCKFIEEKAKAQGMSGDQYARERGRKDLWDFCERFYIQDKPVEPRFPHPDSPTTPFRPPSPVTTESLKASLRFSPPIFYGGPEGLDAFIREAPYSEKSKDLIEELLESADAGLTAKAHLKYGLELDPEEVKRRYMHDSMFPDMTWNQFITAKVRSLLSKGSLIPKGERARPTAAQAARVANAAFDLNCWEIQNHVTSEREKSGHADVEDDLFTEDLGQLQI